MVISSVAMTLCAIFLVQVQAFDCVFDSGLGATYDLNTLTKNDGELSYLIRDGDIDCTVETERNFTYAFNVCGDVTTLPSSDACPTDAAAIQLDEDPRDIDDDEAFCSAAGRMDPIFSLLDNSDPSAGLIMTYGNGDYCTSIPRHFHLNLECSDVADDVVHPTEAYETAYCEYTITMPSIRGCPVECIDEDVNLCGNHGHCAYDLTSTRAHCYCDDGYTGDLCTEEQSSGSGSGSAECMSDDGSCVYASVEAVVDVETKIDTGDLSVLIAPNTLSQTRTVTVEDVSSDIVDRIPSAYVLLMSPRTVVLSGSGDENALLEMGFLPQLTLAEARRLYDTVVVIYSQDDGESWLEADSRTTVDSLHTFFTAPAGVYSFATTATDASDDDSGSDNNGGGGLSGGQIAGIVIGTLAALAIGVLAGAMLVHRRHRIPKHGPQAESDHSGWTPLVGEPARSSFREVDDL